MVMYDDPLHPKAYLTIPPHKRRYNLEGDLRRYLYAKPLNDDELLQRRNLINKDRGIVYSITNSLTGWQYIGATVKGLGLRFKWHKKESRKKMRTRLSQDMFHMGAEHFYAQHIATAIDVNYLAELEQMVIAQESPVYNIAAPQQNPRWRHR